jgi:hypothetical protein
MLLKLDAMVSFLSTCVALSAIGSDPELTPRKARCFLGRAFLFGKTVYSQSEVRYGEKDSTQSVLDMSLLTFRRRLKSYFSRSSYLSFGVLPLAPDELPPFLVSYPEFAPEREGVARPPAQILQFPSRNRATDPIV